MPYFVRKRWHEMHGADPEPVRAAAAPGMAQIAEAVLHAETAGRDRLDGPFRCRRPAGPGSTARITLSVEADGADAPLTVTLSAGDLQSRAGHRIPAASVTLDPADLSVAPGESRPLEVAVRVPRDAVPGLYAGRITGSGDDALNLVIEVEVVAA